jgi:exopolyphosphatase/guanosine-5'-triphosphate,3'-diphosphate pyrophosphatase
MRVAAIDVGSNSIRLLVADVAGGGPTDSLETVARAGEACRLGRGLDKTGLIEAEMLERATGLVAEFARRARSLGATRTIVGATAALRSAANGGEAAERIRERTGLPVRILTGDQEARLVYRAVVGGLGAAARRSACVVFDLGGGSTEVVSGVGESVGRWASLPFGAVTLTERHIHSNPASEADAASIVAEVEQHLMHHCALMPESAPILAGVGGTVTVLATLDRGLTTHEPTLIEGWTIESSRLEARVRQLASSSDAERDDLAMLGTGRADIVVAGALAVGVIARRFRSRGLVCSTQGLRYGLARWAAEEGHAALDAGSERESTTSD